MSWVGSALDLGSRVREFEPRISDHFERPATAIHFLDNELDLKSKRMGSNPTNLWVLLFLMILKDTISNLINYWNSIVRGSNPLR